MAEPSLSTSSPLRWRGVAAGALALGLAVFALEGVPRLREAGAVAAAVADARERLATAETAPARLASLRAERKRLEARLAESPGAGRLTPRTALSAVQVAAQESGVEVTTLEPGAPVRDGELERLPIRLRVRGPYDALGRFVTAMETPAEGSPPLRVLAAEIGWGGALRSRTAPLVADLDVEAIRVVRGAAPPASD